MPTSLSRISVSPCVREAFDVECLAMLKTRVQRPLLGHDPQDLLPRFAGHYQHLCALPRRMRRTIERHWKRTLSAIALLMTLGQAPALAAVIPVAANTPPSINSDGKCSLIEAIVNANNNAATHSDCVAGSGSTDRIVLPAGSVQKLKSWQVLPDIRSRIVIEGRRSTIARSTATQSYLTFFHIRSSGNLTLNKLTVSGTTVSGVSGGYGGVVNDRGILALNESSILNTFGRAGVDNSGGRVMLTDSIISGNNNRRDHASALSGGGIRNLNGGAITLVNSVVSDNGAWFSGGGILNGRDSSISLIDSTVAQNRITYKGTAGGISNLGTLILSGSRVLDNSGNIYAGGGILNEYTGTATLANSTISGNRASLTPYPYAGGGGILNRGSMTLTNCTVSGNSADYGGGVENVTSHASGVEYPSELTLTSSTVTGNAATYEGGGLLVSYGTVTLTRTLVSGNTASRGPEINNAPLNHGSGGVLTADNYNLFGHDGNAGAVGFSPGPLDIVPTVPVDSILLALADNGGGTWTHALAIGSPALDASPHDADCPATDQRGNPRPRGAACDIGAFEGSAVLCNGLVTTMVGTEKSDVLTGTPGPDVISGLGGNDVIHGLGGDDVICGGGGNDRLYGGAGNDQLLGVAGNDRLFGQGNDDTLDGGNGTDQCDGGGNSPAGDTANACETLSHVP